MIAKNACIIICGYVLGCVTAGYYWTRWRTGEDVRDIGSGSVGATNVGRRLGASGFAITILFDFIEGFVVVAAAHRLQVSQTVIIVCMVAAVAGHIWPIQLRFQGGKGIATSLGAICLYNPKIALTLLCEFAAIYFVTRRFVLSGMIASRLIGMIAAHFIDQGFDLGILSGTVRHLRFYKHMGCVPFGPIVGNPEALFQPMYLTLDSFISNCAAMSQSKIAILSGSSQPSES